MRSSWRTRVILVENPLHPELAVAQKRPACARHRGVGRHPLMSGPTCTKATHDYSTCFVLDDGPLELGGPRRTQPVPQGLCTIATWPPECARHPDQSAATATSRCPTHASDGSHWAVIATLGRVNAWEGAGNVVQLLRLRQRQQDRHAVAADRPQVRGEAPDGAGRESHGAVGEANDRGSVRRPDPPVGDRRRVPARSR